MIRVKVILELFLELDLVLELELVWLDFFRGFSVLLGGVILNPTHCRRAPVPRRRNTCSAEHRLRIPALIEAIRTVIIGAALVTGHGSFRHGSAAIPFKVKRWAFNVDGR